MQQANPDLAQMLLEGDFDTEVQVNWIGNARLSRGCDCEVCIETTPGDIALAGAARDLAEIVAGLRYEYVVRVETRSGDAYVFWEDGTPHLAWDPTLASWYNLSDSLETVVERVSKHFGWPAYVGRRLVSETERAK